MREGHVSQKYCRNRNYGDGAHHLPCSHANGLDREFSITHVEEIFETRPQKIDDEDVVQTFLAKMVDLRDTNCERMMGQANVELNILY